MGNANMNEKNPCINYNYSVNDISNNNISLNYNEEVITPQNKEMESEKRCGKSYINNILGKLELFEHKEIYIIIKDPIMNISNRIKILNDEILDNILHDYYPNYTPNIIPTLNGFILHKDISIKENNVQENDEIYISDPIEIYFCLSDGNKYISKASRYQIFFDLFQRFRSREVPKEYKYRLIECYYNERVIGSYDIVQNLGIKRNDEIFVMVGIDNNTKCLYDKGVEILNKFNYIYLDNKEKEINLHDIKIEVANKTFDEEELLNFSMINFTNLKILSLINCKIHNLFFLSSPPLNSLKILNLQKNLISFFVDLNLLKLEQLNLSYNNFNRNMMSIDDNKNIKKSLYINLPSLKQLNLSNNKIDDIHLLSHFKIDSLKELKLNNNEIENITVLNNVPFRKLRTINLSNNKISDISVFAELSFCNNIENIDLMNNEIVNINILRNISLPRLKVFNLLNNDITDYSVLRLIFFPKLETLYAFPNQLDPDNYDKSSDIYINFIESCDNIKQKGVEIKYYL
jgi:Leucine-rich repeat (LRR) protein